MLPVSKAGPTPGKRRPSLTEGAPLPPAAAAEGCGHTHIFTSRWRVAPKKPVGHAATAGSHALSAPLGETTKRNGRDASNRMLAGASHSAAIHNPGCWRSTWTKTTPHRLSRSQEGNTAGPYFISRCDCTPATRSLTWEYHVLGEGSPHEHLDPGAHPRDVVAVLEQPPGQLHPRRMQLFGCRPFGRWAVGLRTAP